MTNTHTQKITAALKDWIPHKLFEENNELFCRWIFMGDHRFLEPFFDDSVSKCRQLPENSSRFRVISNMVLLPEWAKYGDQVAPSGIIFHVSRCGSTTISQLLTLSESNIVLSEVPFLDEILRWGFRKQLMKEMIPLFKAAVDLYGCRRFKENQNLFIKTDSWHIHFYELYRELYPGIPFFLLYRRPDEVVRSHQKRRGMQAIPGVIEPGIFGFRHEPAARVNLDEYLGKVLQSYFKAFLEILAKDQQAYPLNYNQGMLKLTEFILDKTGATLTASDLKAMQERSVFHGKYPDQVFHESPIATSPPEYMRPAFELFQKLEVIRKHRVFS